jgi:hypothetical protein
LKFQDYIVKQIEAVKSQGSGALRDRPLEMRMFQFPPFPLDSYKGNPVFFRDKHHTFTNNFYYGNEMTMLLMDICLYTAWDLITGNTLLSIFLAYLIDKFIERARLKYGVANLSAKTFIDDRFLD